MATMADFKKRDNDLVRKWFNEAAKQKAAGKRGQTTFLHFHLRVSSHPAQAFINPIVRNGHYHE